MTQKTSLRLSAAGALYCATALFTTTSHTATFLLQDVTQWIGPSAGPGISQAALVIQWPGQEALAWGYRWNTSETRDGRDLLLALAGVDARFSISGSGFISDLGWDADLNGTPEFTFPGFNGTTGEYLNYFVNNNQKADNYNNGAAPAGAHILPPLGSPYDEAGPGTWVASNTGVLGRPLVDGSWDGWVYSAGEIVPALAVNAPAPIPEPSLAGLLALTGVAGLQRRRRIA